MRCSLSISRAGIHRGQICRPDGARRADRRGLRPALLAHAAPLAVLAWLFSLCSNCASSRLLLSLRRYFFTPGAAAAFVTGFYVLCRTVTGLRLISEHPTAGAESCSINFWAVP